MAFPAQKLEKRAEGGQLPAHGGSGKTLAVHMDHVRTHRHPVDLFDVDRSLRVAGVSGFLQE